MGLSRTFWFPYEPASPTPPPLSPSPSLSNPFPFFWDALKHAPLEERLSGLSRGWSKERIKQKATQSNSVSFNEAGIFNVSPGLAYRIVAECNILNKKRCV